MIAERLGIEPEVAAREGHLAGEKDRIATAALAEVPDGGSLAIDAGTTTVRLAELLPLDRRLTVVTHSLPVAMALVGRPNIDLHLLGGQAQQLALTLRDEIFRMAIARRGTRFNFHKNQ